MAARAKIAATADDDARLRAEVSGRLPGFLSRLDAAHIHDTLAHTRPESLMVDISLPGWHREAGSAAGGSTEIERYRSVAGVEDDTSLLEELLTKAGIN